MLYLFYNCCKININNKHFFLHKNYNNICVHLNIKRDTYYKHLLLISIDKVILKLHSRISLYLIL